MRIAIVTATPHSLANLPPGAEGVALGHAADLSNATRAFDALVIASDGFAAEAIETLAAAVREDGRQCIEVRADRWDGQSPSPLSAACRGVISGFGDGGVLAAVRVISA